MNFFKNITISLIFLGLTLSINAQTVDSIKVEQAGDKILIHYKILQSNELQVFKITLSCITSTGLKLEPRSLSGDYGENVIGGKADYMIVWDALKDLDELQSAEFLVKAELVKGKATYTKGSNLTGWDKKRFHLMVAGDYPGPKLGIRLGYIGKWGIAANFLYGKAGLNSHQRKEPSISDIPVVRVPYFDLELSKRLVNRNGFQMYFYAGPSYTKLLVLNRTTNTFYTRNSYLFNDGFYFDMKRFTVSVGTSSPGPGIHDKVESESSDNISLLSPDTYLIIGLGIKF